MKIPRNIEILTIVLMFSSALIATAGAEFSKMKMTTPIPAEITTPDKVETRLGTLSFKNGIADQETVKKIYDNIDFSRAVNVYLSTLSGVSNWGQRQGQRDAGVPDNTLLTMEQMMDSTGMWLTPNTTTPQTWLFLSLKDGPMVLEVPPNVLGPVDDMWMRYVTDLGPLGPDKGKGGKYLFLPPGYEGKVPKSGYFVVKSPTFGLWAPWRNFAVNGDVNPALESMRKHTRIYPLSEAGKEHGPVPSKNGSMLQINTVPPNTYLYWEYLNNLVQEEPAGLMGPEITGHMASIGIEKGKPFKPDARMKKILTEAVAVGNATARVMSFDNRDETAYFYGKQSAWFNPFHGGYNFEENGARVLDGRTIFHYGYAGITPAMEQKNVGSGSQYACAAKDSDGNGLDGSKTYKITLPPNIPQKNFWTISAYDTQTRSLLQTDYKYPAIGQGKGFPRAGIQTGPVKQNADGSTDIYFGPKAPEGKEGNWVQTTPGRGWFVVFRLYSPLQPWFDKTWRPGEFKPVK